MRKRDILISLAIIIGALLVSYVLFRQEGDVVLETPGASLRLTRASVGETTVTSLSPVRLPVRAYTPERLTITREDDDGTWQLASTGPWGDLATIKVVPRQTTSLAVGPPLRIVPKADVKAGRGSVELRILGQAGEKYSNAVLRNGKRIPAPSIKILDQEGNVLASGNFAYG